MFSFPVQCLHHMCIISSFTSCPLWSAADVSRGRSGYGRDPMFRSGMVWIPFALLYCILHDTLGPSDNSARTTGRDARVKHEAVRRRRPVTVRVIPSGDRPSASHPASSIVRGTARPGRCMEHSDCGSFPRLSTVLSTELLLRTKTLYSLTLTGQDVR